MGQIADYSYLLQIISKNCLYQVMCRGWWVPTFELEIQGRKNVPGALRIKIGEIFNQNGQWLISSSIFKMICYMEGFVFWLCDSIIVIHTCLMAYTVFPLPGWWPLTDWFFYGVYSLCTWQSKIPPPPPLYSNTISCFMHYN